MLRPIAIAAILGALALQSFQSQPVRAASSPGKPVSGCVNQKLTDGFWSLKVTSATLGTLSDSTQPAWNVTFEFGNAQSKVATPNARPLT